jgi:hypothetical protein
MTGDHHGQSTGRATLLVRGVDAILGTHNRHEGPEQPQVHIHSLKLST